MILSRSDVLAQLAGLKLGPVFGCDVRLSGSRSTSVDESERQVESGTHRMLREELVAFCDKSGIGVYPHNVGRQGHYAMADALLCLGDAPPLFIEILGSPQAITPENLRRKRAIGSPGAPLRFLVTGFDYECYIGDGDKPGWGTDVVIEGKDDILCAGALESELTTRGMLRKRRRWQYPPTIWMFIRQHFGQPPLPPLRDLVRSDFPTIVDGVPRYAWSWAVPAERRRKRKRGGPISPLRKASM
jgi:hypothetical protein